MSLQDLPSSAAGTSLGAAKGGALRPGTPRIGPLRGKGGVRRGRAPGGAGSPEFYRDPGADSEMPARRGACPRLLRPPPATPPRWGRFSPFTAESLPAHKGGVSALLATAPDFWWRLYFPAGTRRTEGPASPGRPFAERGSPRFPGPQAGQAAHPSWDSRCPTRFCTLRSELPPPLVWARRGGRWEDPLGAAGFGALKRGDPSVLT